MAAGDVVSAVSSIAAAASLDYQPAAGVEAIIRHVDTSSGAADLAVGIYDGTNHAAHTMNPALSNVYNVFIPVTNSKYLRLTNNNVGAKILSYGGIQTK